MSLAADPQVVALVPMRRHSARVEGKNYRVIAGQPLYAYILESLSQCKAISKIVVDTDSPEITRGIRELFPQVILIDRPEHLRADDVPMNEILLHDIEQVDSRFYLQTHCTNPLLSADTIDNAVQSFFEGWPGVDSLFSVTPFQTRFWTVKGDPVNHNPHELIPTQDLEPLLLENSCLYVFSGEGLKDNDHRIGQKPILFEIDHEEAVDIDTEWDFTLAELLLQARDLKS
jgi:CMP-N-acetylneuraminic acid synthetase